MIIRKCAQLPGVTKCIPFLLMVTCIAIYISSLPIRIQITFNEQPASRFLFPPDAVTLERLNVLQKYLSDTQSKDFAHFYEALELEVLCPKVERVGSKYDGGKWTCNPSSLPDDCVVYSLGIGGDITFELHIDNISKGRCKMYSFDPDEKQGSAFAKLKSNRFIFLAFQVADVTNEANNTKSVQDVMKLLKHDLIDFFKIDIEGGEFQVLPSLLTNREKPVACQLFVEMHGTPSQIGQLLQKISQAGYYIFSKEVNGMFPQYCEFSFIHENCFKRHGIEKIVARNFA